MTSNIARQQRFSTFPRRAIAVISWLALCGSGHAASIIVNTATDDFGSVGSNCSLREAIQSANTNVDFGGCTHSGGYGAVTDTIALPTLGAGGAFNLTRVGTDDSNSAGDLDISSALIIDGVSATNSLIRGVTGDPDNERHRLIHVISGTAVLNDLTLRDGLENNSTAGGGLRTEPGSTTTLNRVVVTGNIADGNAGGILNRGTMTLNDSIVSFNQTRDALNGGGGLFNSPNATLTINDSKIVDNLVKSSDVGDSDGGGIYSDVDSVLTLDNSVVDGNLADGRRLIADNGAKGGGIFAAGTLTLMQSSVTNNEAVGIRGDGGGIYTSADLAHALINRSVISLNLARESLAAGGNAAGGGIGRAANGGAFTIQDSVISANHAQSNGSSSGGGLMGTFRILTSTVANNVADGGGDSEGGGMSTNGSSTVVNSTFVGNTVDGDGGGISFGSGVGLTLRVRNSTFAANTSGGVGGGIYVTLGNFVIANTVLAGNSAVGGGADCSGAISSAGFNLLQAASGCGLTSVASDQINVTASLAAATNNGGPVAGSSLGIISGMTTRAPLPASPLLDAGDADGCDNTDSTPLATDQIGRNRAIDGDADGIARCDIGAIEFSNALFEDGFE